MKRVAGIMSTAKTARVGNCSNTSHLLSRLAEVGEKAGLLNDLKQHAEQLEKKIRQLEKEAEKYKVSALQLCCGPIITAVHPGSLCPRALKLTARRRNEPRGGEAASPGRVPAGPSGSSTPDLLAELLAILFSERAFNSTTL